MAPFSPSSLLHGTARVAISHILEADGFADRAIALVHVAALARLSTVSQATVDRAGAAARLLPLDHAAPAILPHLARLAVPDRPEDLAAVLALAICDVPSSAALPLQTIWALGTIWPHASTRERAALWQRALSGLSHRRGPAESIVSRATLTSWQRNVPTSTEPEPPSASSLAALLECTTPLDAYLQLASYLGCGSNPSTLAWILGALAEQVALRVAEPGVAVHTLGGAVAAQWLSRRAPPEVLVVLLSQLAHQIWWSARQPPGETSGRHAIRELPLADAVHAGNPGAARRAARKAADRPAAFWAAALDLLDQASEQPGDGFPHALRAVTMVGLRAGAHTLSPDDAALIAQQLAHAFSGTSVSAAG